MDLTIYVQFQMGANTLVAFGNSVIQIVDMTGLRL